MSGSMPVENATYSPPPAALSAAEERLRSSTSRTDASAASTSAVVFEPCSARVSSLRLRGSAVAIATSAGSSTLSEVRSTEVRDSWSARASGSPARSQCTVPASLSVAASARERSFAQLRTRVTSARPRSAGTSVCQGTIFLRRLALRSSCTRWASAASGSSSAHTPPSVSDVERILRPMRPHEPRAASSKPAPLMRRNWSASPRAHRSPNSLSDASIESCESFALARAAPKMGSKDSGSSCVRETPSWHSEAARESNSAN